MSMSDETTETTEVAETTRTPKQELAAIAALQTKLAAAEVSLLRAENNCEPKDSAEADKAAVIAEARTHLEWIDGKISDARVTTLIRVAGDFTPAQFKKIAEANRVSTNSTITLPAGRYENLSRGKGWCRLGSGSSAEWATKTDSGYWSVDTPGKWTVGSTDGFKRKDQTPWTVAKVGDVWIAN